MLSRRKHRGEHHVVKGSAVVLNASDTYREDWMSVEETTLIYDSAKTDLLI